LRVSEQIAEENILPKREEGSGGWSKLHNEELHSPFSSPDAARVIRSRE
jgi:hypothetical protein